jgi:hypothetical protein
MNKTVIDDAEEASLSVASICEMAATMNETYKKIMRIPKHLYGEYYLHEKAKHDARPVTMEYDEWKMQEWDETFDSLKDKQMQVVAEFLTKRPLRFSRKPSIREVGKVRMDLVQNRLPSGFVYCEDFDEMCARFRKLNSWEGDIMKLDYNRYGKYLLQNFHKMTSEERQAFFDLDIMVELINKDIAKVMPVEVKEEEEIVLSPEEDALLVQLQPMLYGSEDNAKTFLGSIQGMKGKQITDMVNMMIAEKKLSELSCHRDLYMGLHDAGIYDKSESNWNMQVR